MMKKIEKIKEKEPEKQAQKKKVEESVQKEETRIKQVASKTFEIQVDESEFMQNKSQSSDGDRSSHRSRNFVDEKYSVPAIKSPKFNEL